MTDCKSQGKEDIEGLNRRCEADRGIALAGKSTLNRMELIPAFGAAHRYHRMGYDPEKVDELMVDIFVESSESAPGEIIIDLDNTDDPLKIRIKKSHKRKGESIFKNRKSVLQKT